MRAGGLIHRVIIQRQHKRIGSMGGTEKSWSDYWACWAEVRDLSGSEVLQSEQVKSKIIARCFIRYKSGLDSSMRLLHGDNIYQIESFINKDGKNNMLELLLFEFR